MQICGIIPPVATPMQANDDLYLPNVRGRVPVYAGTGAESTREAVRLTKIAEKQDNQDAND